MPSTPSNDDQFADLFSRLPDPAVGSTRTSTTTGPTSVAASNDARPSGRPLSRREAREAAAREAAARTQPGEPVAGPAADPRPATDGPAATRDEPAPVVDPSLATATAADYPVVTAAMAARSPQDDSTPDAGTGHTLDALFDAAAERQRDSHDRDRRKSRIAAWTVFGVVLALIGGLVYGGFWVWNTYEQPIREFFGWTEPKDYEAGLAEGEATITIVTGQTGADISATLYDAGVTKTSGVFYDYLIGSGKDPNQLKPGVFTLQQKMTAAAAFEALVDPANKLENSAQLREGLTVEQSLPLLADGIQIPLEEFEAAVADPSAYGVEADTLEGWLFPATYTFEPDVTAVQVIQTLVDRTVRSLDDAGVPVDRRHEILTIASIIEREARFSDDFFKVSRVIQNRLDPANTETHGLLQMDSTAQFGYNEMHDGTVSSSAEALEDDNPWNTYIHAGLPKGPIANPGDLAIEAAMNPAEGPWLYFVTVNPSSGETEFAETYEEHLQLVEKWQQWCADNPDNGDC